MIKKKGSGYLFVFKNLHLNYCTDQLMPRWSFSTRRNSQDIACG